MHFHPMAWELLSFLTIQVNGDSVCSQRRLEMNMGEMVFERCQLEQKKVIEGFCLSYDMIRGVCLENMKPCVASVEGAEIEEKI